MKEHKIGDCIARLRKEKGWTQDVLAEKLLVSNKAISKWESNKGDPSLEFLPKLADLFGVSLDYLMTGKEIKEVVNYDDMDAVKRAVRIVMNDDVENFQKYKYDNDSILYDKDENYHDRYNETYNLFQLNTKIRDSIYENESKNIFSLVLSKFMDSKDVKDRFLRNNDNQFYLIKEKDNFIKMCALSNRVDVLKELKVKNYKIVSDIVNSAETYYIKESVLNFILTNKDISKEVLDYFCSSDTQNEEIIQLIYNTKRYDYLENILSNYINNANRIYNTKVELAKEKKDYLFINNSKLQMQQEHNANYWQFHKRVYSFELIDEMHKSNKTLLGFVSPIIKAFDSAINNNDIVWIKKFNEYNTKISKELEIECKTFSDKEIKLMEMRLDKKEKLENIIIYKNVDNKLINLSKLYSSLMNELKNETEDDKIDYLKKFLNEKKIIFEKVSKEYYVCYSEFIEDCISKKNYKELFEFATDNYLQEMQNAVMSSNNDEIKKICESLFGYSENEVKEYTVLSNKLNDVQIRLNQAMLDKNHWVEAGLTHEHLSVHNQVLDFKQRYLKKHSSFKNLLEIQMETLPFVFSTNEDVLAKCEEYKEKCYKEFIEQIEDYVENKTHEKQMVKEYEKIQKEISFEYLENEVGNGNIENAVIKLCVRLEACLKYKYRYEGDLFTMLDTYTKKYLQWPNTCDDDYDGANARVDFERELLHKLRLKRNNIVHAENNSVEFDNNDIMDCIEILRNM